MAVLAAQTDNVWTVLLTALNVAQTVALAYLAASHRIVRRNGGGNGGSR